MGNMNELDNVKDVSDLAIYTSNGVITPTTAYILEK